MYLSILNTDTAENLLRVYLKFFDYAGLSAKRFTKETSRGITLAMARDLLVSKNILPVELAQLTEIERHASGEPFLKYPENVSQTPLHISLSHSGKWFACLLSSPEQPSCIDLEDLNIARRYLKISEHYFSSDEIAYVQQTGRLGFYKIWTAKEAIAKLQGQGLSQALKIHIDKASLDEKTIKFNNQAYSITQHISEDYVYTIAEHKPS